MNNEYEIINNEIEYLMSYYLDWQDYIERFSFPRIDYYYLIINISIFYTFLEKAKSFLDKNDYESAKNYIPRKIEFKNSVYQNTINIKRILDEMKDVLEKDKEYEKTDE